MEGVGLGGKIRSSVLNTVTLRYLLDIIVEVYSRQGNKMLQHNIVVQAQILGLGLGLGLEPSLLVFISYLYHLLAV